MIRHRSRWGIGMVGFVGAAALGPAALSAQATPDVQGTWEGEVGGTAFVVVIRGDSSASLADQTVRYRLRGDTLQVALGEQWFSYQLMRDGDRLTISGGDLADPITLRYVGLPTPRPDSIPLPPPPSPSGIRP